VARRLPSSIIRLYPELERFKGRRGQLEALFRANQVIEYGFAILLLLATFLIANPIEAALKRLFGLSGAISDLATVGVFGLAMLAALALLIYFGIPHARKKLRLELAMGGTPICVGCGYDLRGQAERRCPECGVEFREGQDEHRQGDSWRVCQMRASSA